MNFNFYVAEKLKHLVCKYGEWIAALKLTLGGGGGVKWLFEVSDAQ